MAEGGVDYYSWSDEDAEDASPFDSDTDDLSDEGRCDYLLLSKGYTSSTSYVYPLALWLSELAHSTVIKLNEQKLSTLFYQKMRKTYCKTFLQIYGKSGRTIV